MRFSTLVFAPLALLTSVVSAAPATFGTQDVFVPHILAPKAGDVWPKGSVQSVKWDTSDAPEHISNGARIQLRNATAQPYFVDIPLAIGFNLRSGEQEVTVPTDVPTGPYKIILFGDSGNLSPAFDIVD
ncbi:hypothetical protein NMY22_g8112 [Coprinellus aureogranulatus]|nr:hypothetical protein NMY22_g8112 [Coprinellus aureogranulatus]